ncbi:MAG: hypothetical protein K9J21_12455 [Bacteroidales bacterium]|nr:hypothetical protein [Bacteroidales bacterium]
MKQTQINPYILPGVVFQMNDRENLKRMETKWSEGSKLQAIHIFICDYFQIKESKLFEKNRERKYAEPRQIFMALAVEYTPGIFKDIAVYADRDHSTVSHALKLCKDGPLISLYKDVSHRFSEIMKVEKVIRKPQKVGTL